ncbi:MAG: drug/metabolite exporter YedA [Phycisphaerales bacterium]|nr:drug/metabolite exporter YedA [Phycisphaerales bacterium]
MTSQDAVAHLDPSFRHDPPQSPLIKGGGNGPSTLGLVAAFAAIYIIWGSTYLAIRYAVETLPPFLMAGTRFLTAGAMLYGWQRFRGIGRPKRAHWRSAAIIGGLLLLGGNGGVVWAEQSVPSGVTALLITTVPIWMVLVEWLRRDGIRPDGAVVVGVLLGLAGVVVLVGSNELGGGVPLNRVGAIVLVLASLSWSIGSIYSRSAPLPDSPLLLTAMEMLCGGGLLFVAGLLSGEAGRVTAGDISLRSVLSLGYLIVFGSLIAFSSYVWLLGVTTPARVSTYAFVNPVVAVLLGVTVAGEPFGVRTAGATVIIVTAVVLITTRARRAKAVVGDRGRYAEAENAMILAEAAAAGPPGPACVGSPFAGNTDVADESPGRGEISRRSSSLSQGLKLPQSRS